MQRHETDWFSLIVGAMFVVIGLGFALNPVIGWNFSGAFAIPLALIGLGVGGVVAAVLSDRSRRAATNENADEASASAPGPIA